MFAVPGCNLRVALHMQSTTVDGSVPADNDTAGRARIPAPIVVPVTSAVAVARLPFLRTAATTFTRD